MFYAANSLGAAAGALLAGFVLIPLLGTAGTWLVAAILMMLCGFYWSRQHLSPAIMWVALLCVTILAWPVRQLPAASHLLAHELPHADDVYQFEDAVSITHVVERDDGQRILLADLQRMDAASDPTSVAVQKNQARLPLFLHGDAKQVLFLGLGTGITASGALAWPHVQVDAVELSQGAVFASKHYFEAVNGALPARIHVIHDDARRYLMRSQKTYDVIVGDLFHPDMVGRGALLSVEQFERARRHLNHDGLFVQWLALNQFDVSDMQVVMRSFAAAFANNAVFIDGYRMALVGFQGKMRSARDLLHAAPEDRMWGGEGGWTWLGRYWSGITPLLKGSSTKAVQGEWSPVIEYTLPHMRYQEIALPKVLRWLMQSRVGFQDAVKTLRVKRADQQRFKRAWAGTSLSIRSQWEALLGKPSVSRLQQLAYRANPKDRWIGFGLADAMFESLSHGLPAGKTYEQALQMILSIRPDHEAALKAMLSLMQQSKNEQAVREYRERLKALSPYARITL